ncbi:MAG: type II CAAX endopeptidase family protein [Capsulimonadales bacterium]|nr:type II CAAX endopeptidase family protein [Capsulimonadales bacterium]
MPTEEITSENNRDGRPGSEAGGRRIPFHTLLWLALGVLSLVAMAALERPENRNARQPTLRGPSAIEFRTATAGEAETRVALAFHRFGERTKTETGAASIDRMSLDSAIKTYREALPVTTSANVARRILILEHLAGKPTDPRLLNEKLPALLRKRGTAPGEIAPEIALWKALYVPGSPTPPADARRRIDAMDLRILGLQATIDLLERTGDRSGAARLIAERNRRSVNFLAIFIFLSVVGVLAFFTGVGFLIFFAQAALFKRGDLVGEVFPRPSPVTFMDLIDVFAFYFMVFEGSRLVLGALLSSLLGRNRATLAAGGDGTVFLLFELGAYLFPHVLAAIYLAVSMKRKFGVPADVGLTSTGIFRDIGYGILGYCASLPLLFLLGQVSERIFRDNVQVTPNPAMSLIASRNDPVDRILLFFLIAIAAPLCEELFFRGVFLTGLRKRYGAVFSVIVSAVVFAIGHPVQDWLPILGLGITFGTLRELRQSLVPSITAHFLQNSATYLYLSLLFGDR